MFVDFGSMPQDQMTFQQQFPQLFQQGLADQKDKKWDDAISKYQNLLDQGQNSLTSEQASVIYHNMAASSFEKADFLKSYVWTKKSLSLDSGNDFAKDLLSEVTKKFQPQQVAHQISAFQSAQKAFLKNTTFDFVMITFLVLFAFSFFLGCKTWLNKKQAQLEGESTSVQQKNPLGLMLAFGFTFVFTFLMAGTVFLKWKDNQTPKAIVSAEKTAVQTASGGDQATIYDATAGLEVDILKIEANFVQIRYPGAFSGWVDKKNLEILYRLAWP